MDVGLTAEEKVRYSRHLMIPGIGEEGQTRLKNGSVLLVGLGALGSPVAMYLAAAGVGRLGVVDADVVEETNLQRQILHGQPWVGKKKWMSAEARIREINPWVKVEAYDERLTVDNAERIATGYDVIVDGSDNFATRFLTNDLAYFLKKPLVYGAIHRFEGQVGVFAPHLGGGCYRCLLPEMPAPGSAPTCQEAGVLGVLPGVIGTMQAMEALKCLLGVGRIPVGELKVYDGLASQVRTLKLQADPECRLCGTREITQIRNSETTAQVGCGMAGAHMEEISTQELRERMKVGGYGRLVDVREGYEHQMGHIAEAELVPMGEVPARMVEWSKGEEIYVICKAGVRSARIVEYLQAQGFERVVNVAGGMDAWQRLARD